MNLVNQAPLVSLCLAFLCNPAFGSSPSVLFSEDFESGLQQWTGKLGQPHHGVTLPDPLNTGRGNVLQFTALNTIGDMFSTVGISSGDFLVIRFDYLGLPTTGSIPGDLGGFLGIADAPGDPDFPWLASTSSRYPDAYQLVDDGQWHTINLTIDGGSVGTFHIALEDWVGSGGVAGDAYFDNIMVIPEPSTMALACLAGIGFFMKRMSPF